MDSIEKDNPTLKGVLPKDYGRPALDKQRLGELIDLIGSITLSKNGNGKGKPARPGGGDVLGFVFEYFLGQFADAEGKKGGQFYTPQSIVKLLVEMLAPEPEKRVYDGCCGSGGMFVQSERFIELHEHRKGKISVYGQESNPTTFRLAKMNLAIRGIDAKIELGDTLMNDKFPELKVDYIIANSATLPIVSTIAEKQGKKIALTYFMPPVVPTREFPLGDFDFLNFGWYNQMTYKIAHSFYWKFVKAETNEYRQELGRSGNSNLLRAFVAATVSGVVAPRLHA
jgi:hypothetical protein